MVKGVYWNCSINLFFLIHLSAIFVAHYRNDIPGLALESQKYPGFFLNKAEKRLQLKPMEITSKVRAPWPRKHPR